VSEFIFPTQFEPPELPNQVGGFLEQAEDQESDRLGRDLGQGEKRVQVGMKGIFR
jgi:hypothetical protein